MYDLRYSVQYRGLPWWLSSKESACNAGDPGSVPGWGRSSGGENDNSLQYSCLGNPMDRGDWQTAVLGVIKVLATKQQQRIT